MYTDSSDGHNGNIAVYVGPSIAVVVVIIIIIILVVIIVMIHIRKKRSSQGM